MSDPTLLDTSPESFADLPMQPTGSGVADLEIAYEQMMMAEDANADSAISDEDSVLTTTDRSTGGVESEVYPS